MKALLNPELSFSYISQFHTNKLRNSTHSPNQTSLRFPSKYRIGKGACLVVKAALDSAIIDQLGLSESDIRNPSVSTSYRSSKLPKPNQTLHDAQARVCTGPTQTRPLSEEQAFKVFDTILRSGWKFLFLFLFFVHVLSFCSANITFKQFIISVKAKQIRFIRAIH